MLFCCEMGCPCPFFVIVYIVHLINYLLKYQVFLRFQYNWINFFYKKYVRYLSQIVNQCRQIGVVDEMFDEDKVVEIGRFGYQ